VRRRQRGVEDNSMLNGLFLQATLSGVTNGFVYALVGIGMAVIFKGSRIINAMQGEFSVIGAIFAVFALKIAGMPYALACIGGILTGALTGFLCDVLFVRPMMRRGAAEESYLLLTIGLSFALSAAVLFFAGRDSHLLPAIAGSSVFDVGPATIPVHAVWLIVISTGLVLALRAFYRHTSIGLAMMAASIDADGAATIGINVNNMRTATFLLGGALGAVAGLLVTPLIAVSYHMGIVLTLKGFAAAILGGLVNPMGAVIGGLTLGLMESLAVISVPSGYKDAVAMTMLIVIMIVLPNGILGKAGRKGG
jgi:branched-chain amino acid transport system permease protein